MSSSLRVLGRRKIAVLVAAFLLFGGVIAYRTTARVEAHETTAVLTMQCGTVGAMPTTYTFSHDPLAAVPGQMLIANVSAAMPPPQASMNAIKIDGVTMVLPIPNEVTQGDIMVMGGNLTKQSQAVSGSSVTLTLAPSGNNVTLGNLQMPSLMIHTTVKANVTTDAILFQGPSSLRLQVTVPIIGAFTETCTPAANNPPVGRVPMQGATTTTDEHGDHGHGHETTTTAAPTTTTTAPTTTTTAPTTTTTRATTTTTAPTTTTTRATTTTSMATTTTGHGHETTTTTAAPTTTTTRATTTTMGPTTTRATTTSTMRTTTTRRPMPTTTMPTDNPFLRLIRRIICVIFRIGC
jgi:hypothetical protein